MFLKLEDEWNIIVISTIKHFTKVKITKLHLNVSLNGVNGIREAYVKVKEAISIIDT